MNIRTVEATVGNSSGCEANSLRLRTKVLIEGFVDLSERVVQLLMRVASREGRGSVIRNSLLSVQSETWQPITPLLHMERVPFSTHGFSVVVCRHPEGRWLAVRETKNRGWWLPAGLVDPGESFIQAAHRECLEEAGITIQLKGVLRVEHSVYGPSHARIRVIFYAEPVDITQRPKQIADKESEEARWVTLEDLKRLAKGQPGLRGPELYEWGSYLEQGGTPASMVFLAREDQPVPIPSFIESSVLAEAIEQGDSDLLRNALLSGCEANTLVNPKQWTPLHFACRLKKEDCVRVLLIAGGDISLLTHKQRNVLHFAAQSSSTILSLIMMSLCLHTAWLSILNQRDALGDSPLHIAALTSGRGYAWELLIQYGADPLSRNQLGLTPEDLADRSFPTSD